MKRIIIVTALLTGCATAVPQPQEVVGKLDAKHANYNSPECIAARKVALEYDDNSSGRMAVAIGSGLLLGPFGLPIVFWQNSHYTDKRKAVNDELARQCEGTARATDTPPATTLTGRLLEIQELRTKGMITEEEYQEQRRRALGQ